jgi:hypothetical protein
MIHFASGDLSSARMNVEKALELSQNCDEKHFEALSNIWLGRILGRDQESDVNEVTQNIYKGIKILDQLKLKPFSAQGYLFFGEFCLAREQRQKALEKLKIAEGMFQEMKMDYWLEKTRNILERF